MVDASREMRALRRLNLNITQDRDRLLGLNVAERIPRLVSALDDNKDHHITRVRNKAYSHSARFAVSVMSRLRSVHRKLDSRYDRLQTACIDHLRAVTDDPERLSQMRLGQRSMREERIRCHEQMRNLEEDLQSIRRVMSRLAALTQASESHYEAELVSMRARDVRFASDRLSYFHERLQSVREAAGAAVSLADTPEAMHHRSDGALAGFSRHTGQFLTYLRTDVQQPLHANVRSAADGVAQLVQESRDMLRRWKSEDQMRQGDEEEFQQNMAIVRRNLYRIQELLHNLQEKLKQMQLVQAFIADVLAKVVNSGSR